MPDKSYNPKIVFKVDIGHRLTLPFEFLDWIKKTADAPGAELWLFPRAWIHDLGLSPPLAAGTWALADVEGQHHSDANDQLDEWVVSPLDVVARADDDPKAGLGAAGMIYRCGVTPKDKSRRRSSWHFTIPVELRDTGLLPQHGGHVWVLREPLLGVISIWRPDSWEAYMATMHTREAR